MTVFTVGPDSVYDTITAAMAAAGPGDTIQLESGYSDELVEVTHNGMTISGDITSTGIELTLAAGIATVTLAGSAPFNLVDAPDNNDITGNDGDNHITVTSGADTVSGGLGNDRLFVDYRAATGAITGNSTSNVAEAGGRIVTITSGFEHVTFWTGSAADTITTGAGDDDIRTGEGVSTVVAGEGANYIVGGSAADTITAGDGGNYVDGGDGANTITTGAGADEIMTGLHADTIVTGAGDDVITAINGADGFDAGAGSDLIIVDYSLAATSVTGGVVSGNFGTGYSGHLSDLVTATLDFSGAETFHVTTGSGNDKVTVGGGDDLLDTGEGNDILMLEAGGDDIGLGGNGRDVLYYGAALTAADSNNGGDEGGDVRGDLLVIQGDYSAGITLGAGALVDVEKFRVLKSVNDDFGYTGGGLFDYDITTVDGNVAAGVRLVVQAGSLQLGEHLTFDGSAELDGRFQVFGGHDSDEITGGVQADHLLGRNGDDTLIGNGGNDRLRGGLGSDEMNGGAGADTFVYAAQEGAEPYANAALESSSLNYDVIIGFNFAEDRIDLPGSVSSLVAVGTGTLSTASFDADLAAALDDALAINGAVLFTADSGDHSGETFLVVDADSDGVYQANLDFVIQLDAPVGTAPLVPDFIV